MYFPKNREAFNLEATLRIGGDQVLHNTSLLAIGVANKASGKGKICSLKTLPWMTFSEEIVTPLSAVPGRNWCPREPAIHP
jgi:hypothetical protein